MTVLTIMARIRAKLGMEERMQQDLLRLLEPTRSEVGCITFDLLNDAGRRQETGNIPTQLFGTDADGSRWGDRGSRCVECPSPGKANGWFP